MEKIDMEEIYLGDGVYASFDGYQIWLAVNHHRNQVVALDPEVMKALIGYNNRINEVLNKSVKPLEAEDPLYDATKNNFDNAEPKRIDIIGHVNHGSSIFSNNADKIILLKNRRGGQTIMVHEDSKNSIFGKPIESIVPIADVIPEQIISKQEFLKMHDKAVESSITDEIYKESRSWDIKKEKKVSHKRTNKRK